MARFPAFVFVLRIVAFTVGILAAAEGEAATPCPVPEPSGGRIVAKGTRLAVAHRAQVVAGGEVALAACGGPGPGNVAPKPNFNVMLADGGGRPLEFRSEGGCDTVLVVASAAGDWLYDDDGGQDGGARIRIDAAPDGRYDVWVGTYAAGSCRARLVLQTAP